MPATEAFKRIGATKEDGSPYLRVQGVSVSKLGRHFRFWEEEIVHQDDNTIELYRAPNNPRRWWFTTQGRGFFAQLIEAKDSDASIFCILNKRGKNDANGKSTATAAAPVLTNSGRPAPGKVVLANADTGEARVVITLTDSLETSSTARFIDQFDLDIMEASVSRTARVATSYSRDPAVRSKVLERAAGICELPQCRTPGFHTSYGLYLETHHVIALSEGGRDATDNVVALCANCHRMAHYSLDREAMRDELIDFLEQALA